MTVSITVRAATQEELGRCGVTDKANLIDGAFAVMRDFELIGLTNEYNTAVWTAPGVNPEYVELLVEPAGGLWVTTRR